MHLDERTYRQLLAGHLDPAQARHLAAHLEGECEACEAFLAERPDADLLDGAVDRALARAAPPSGAPGNDLEYARIRHPARPPARRRPRAGRALALAAAAAVAAAGLAGLSLWRRAPTGWDGVKGAARLGVPARLRFVVVEGAALEKGVSGQRVPASAGLAFEVELGRAADVALVRVAGGAADVFFHERLGPGRTEIASGGRPAAYPLGGLAGPQRFVLVASEAPLPPERAARAAALASPGGAAGDASAGAGLSLDHVEVIVR